MIHVDKETNAHGYVVLQGNDARDLFKLKSKKKKRDGLNIVQVFFSDWFRICVRYLRLSSVLLLLDQPDVHFIS